MRISYKTAVCFLSLSFFACTSGNNRQAATDTPTSGAINIAADEEFKPLTEAEVNVFTGLYSNAKIHSVYKTEDSAFTLLLKDSVRLIVVSRKLLPAEETFFNDKKLFPEQIKIASDAVTFIVNKDNPDTLLSVERLKAIFNGKDSLWHEVNDKSELGKINVVFDYENSGNSRYIQQNLMNGARFPAYCFAMHGNRQVIDYVSKNPNALGIIGANWLGNEYDSSVIKAFKTIKMVAVSAKESSNPNDYVKPWMENMQTGKYPFCRDIYIISREANVGLGSGFLSFVASNKGQRIIVKEGLLPVRMPSYTIHY